MNTGQILTPLSTAGLRAIERDADEISRQVTDAYFQMHPECYKGNADKIRALCKVDFNHHLKFILSAMVTAAPEMFIDYTLWLKRVLESRQLSTQHPIDSFSLMLNFICERIDETDQTIAHHVINQGLDSLRGEGSQLNYYQQPKNTIMTTSEDYTSGLVDGNRKQSEQMIQQLLKQGTSLIDIEVGMVQPAMYEIGRLWQENRISVAQEHLATAISQNALARAFAMADFDDPVERTAICACVEGNHHSLGLRMIADAYELSGWDVTFLGADTPSDSILSQVDSERPDVLALSISLPHQVLALKQLTEQLRSNMGGSMPAIVVGGLAMNNHQSLSTRLDIDNWYLDAKSMQSDIKK